MFDWLCANKLALNFDKTSFSFENSCIDVCSSYKYFAVFIDSKLSLSNHIECEKTQTKMSDFFQVTKFHARKTSGKIRHR